MRSAGKWVLVLGVALLAAWAGHEFGQRARTSEVSTNPENEAAVSRLLATTLTAPDGKSVPLANWQGKVLVVNFWATWCPPCREEMPEFSQAQDEYGANGVQFVGIAIDNAANVADFNKKSPVAYPLLLGAADLPELMAKLGNQQQVLPFTVIIDRTGKLRSSHLGRVTKDILSKQLAPLL